MLFDEPWKSVAREGPAKIPSLRGASEDDSEAHAYPAAQAGKTSGRAGGRGQVSLADQSKNSEKD